MPSGQVKAVPGDVHAELRRHAANAGKSLREYLLGRLVDEAGRPSLTTCSPGPVSAAEAR